MDKRHVICAFVCAALSLLVIQQLSSPRGSSEMTYDYASETNGAKLVDTGETDDYIFCKSSMRMRLYFFSTIFVVNFHLRCPDRRALILPGALPDECWAFKGSRGEATIRLAGTVRITAISIEHISADISPTREISSAPRLFQLEGLEFRWDPNPHNFGIFEYDKEGKPIQYFEVLHPSPKGYNLVRMRVLTNWGHQEYTCVYRVGVHGELETALSHK